MSRLRATPPPQGSPVAACLAISLACGAPAPTAGSGGADDQGSETTDPATTIPLPPDPSATSTTLPTTTVADGGTDSEGSVFLQRPDGSNPNFECDIGLQDCEPGFKCMPYNERPGEMWDASACFPAAVR